MQNGPIQSNLLRLSLLLLLPLLLLSTCKKDNCPDEPSELCPCEGDACIEEMMAYTYFLPGSWWVYEEQNSGARDSVYVYEANSSVGSDGSHHFLMRTHSTYDEYNYYYQFAESISSVGITRPECRVQRVLRTKTRPGDFVGTGSFFFVPFILNDYRYEGSGLLSIDSIFHDNEILRIYFDIEECKSEHYEHAGFYLEPNIGISQKLLFEQNKTWKLVAHEIHQ